MQGSDGMQAGRVDAPARVLLAGRFAQPGCPDRHIIEALIGFEHDVLPEPAALRRASCGIPAPDAADLVVVDLSGSVAAVLELVARLRLAVDDPGVPLLGVMPSDIDPLSEVYLAAVVDETVSHAQMAERLPCLVRRAWHDLAGRDPVGDEGGDGWDDDAPGRSWPDARGSSPTRH